MPINPNEATKILQANHGFADPAGWIDYAIRNDFKRVRSDPVVACPDCGGRPMHRAVGQYVYYSSLVRLLECSTCHLVWADARIDPRIIAEHFETAYKGNDYFEDRRGPIFRHLQLLVNQHAPHGGHVLDLGGAEGHLLSQIATHRPDLTCTVHDISERAARTARERFNLQTICGPISALQDEALRFDVVLASDVLYYEPDLATAWSVISSLLRDGGTLLIRVPNKLHLIRVTQAIRRALHSPTALRSDDRVPSSIRSTSTFLASSTCSEASGPGLRRDRYGESPIGASSSAPTACWTRSLPRGGISRPDHPWRTGVDTKHGDPREASEPRTPQLKVGATAR